MSDAALRDLAALPYVSGVTKERAAHVTRLFQLVSGCAVVVAFALFFLLPAAQPTVTTVSPTLLGGGFACSMLSKVNLVLDLATTNITQPFSAAPTIKAAGPSWSSLFVLFNTIPFKLKDHSPARCFAGGALRAMAVRDSTQALPSSQLPTFCIRHTVIASPTWLPYPAPSGTLKMFTGILMPAPFLAPLDRSRFRLVQLFARLFLRPSPWGSHCRAFPHVMKMPRQYFDFRKVPIHNCRKVLTQLFTRSRR